MCRMHGATRHQATRFSVVPHSSLSVRQRPLPLCTMRTTYYKNRWTSAHQRNLRLPAVALSTFRGEAHVRESTTSRKPMTWLLSIVILPSESPTSTPVRLHRDFRAFLLMFFVAF